MMMMIPKQLAEFQDHIPPMIQRVRGSLDAINRPDGQHRSPMSLKSHWKDNFYSLSKQIIKVVRVQLSQR